MLIYFAIHANLFFIILNSEALIKRNKNFAIGIIKFVRTLPSNTEANIISRQLLRSTTSVAANYRAACRARSSAEFISKISIVVEEIDETNFWLDLMVEAEIGEKKLISPLLDESLELLKIYSASRKSARGNNK